MRSVQWEGQMFPRARWTGNLVTAGFRAGNLPLILAEPFLCRYLPWQTTWGQSEGRTAFTLDWSLARRPPATFPESGQTEGDHTFILAVHHIACAAVMELGWLRMKSDIGKGLQYVMSSWETDRNVLLLVLFTTFLLTFFLLLLHEGHIHSTVSWATWFILAYTVEARVFPVGLCSIINGEKAVLLMTNSCCLSFPSLRNRKKITLATTNHLPERTLFLARNSLQKETQESVLCDSEISLIHTRYWASL